MEVGVDRFEVTVPTSEDCVWIAGYSEVASTSGLPTHPPGTPQGSLFRAQCVTRLFSVSEVPLADCHDRRTVPRNAERTMEVPFPEACSRTTWSPISSGPLIATQRRHWIDSRGAARRDRTCSSRYKAKEQGTRQQHDWIVCIAVSPLRNNFVQAQSKREAA
jgi:hypothetical protein